MTITTLRPYITDPFVISKMIPSWTTHLAYADKLYFVAASYCNGDNQISQSGSRNLLLVFSVSLRIETELNTFEIGANKRLAGSQTRNARLSFQTDASGAQFKIFSLNECVLFFNPIFSECSNGDRVTDGNSNFNGSNCRMVDLSAIRPNNSR